MNTSPAALPAERIRPDLSSGILPWLPTILASIAIAVVPVAFFAMMVAAFSSWNGQGDAGPILVFYGVVAAWAALMIGAVTTMVIALGRGSRVTLIGLMPMALAASPLFVLL